MKNTYLLACCLLISQLVNAQKVNRVILAQSSPSAVIGLLAENNTFLYISTEGQLIEYGPEFPRGSLHYFPGKLNPYMGRVDNYPENSNPAMRGKPRYIGASAITYYTADENELLTGKIKSIGSNMISYYLAFEDAALRGKIQRVGSVQVNYYGSFDNEAIQGKLQSVGNTRIEYYTSFDDKAFRGKIKQVGPYGLTYFPSFDNRMPGALKSGLLQMEVNGIEYIVKQ
jgi:hypothetical protein